MRRLTLPLLFITLQAFSQEQPERFSPPAPAEPLRHHIQAGPNYTWAHIHPDGLDAAHGNLGGAQAKYEYQAPDSFYAGAVFSWRQGGTEDGNDRDICYIDLNERFGYTFGTWRERHTATLFTGFGYRHYGEEVSAAFSTTVTFNYNEFYIPLGFLTQHQVNCYFLVGLNLIWMPQVYPTVKISPLEGARWILEKKIANFRVEVPLTFIVSKQYHCSVVFEPTFEYWQDGQTTAVTATGVALSIPENTYLFCGANLNVGVDF